MSKEKCPTGEETRLTPAEETALRDERDRARAIAQQIEELQSRPPKVTETPLTFTDAEGAPFAIDYEDGGYDEFTYGQIAKACAERGYAVVSVLGTEPTDEELNRTALGSPGEARRALFRAGSLSRQPEIDELRASERAAQERVKELEKRQAATFGQLSDAQYSKGRILEARIEWEKRATAAVERAATAERRLSALDDTRAVLGMRLEEPDSAAAEKACALHERLETAEDELARVRAELDRVTTSLGGADEHKTKFEAIRERDEARAKLAECEREREQLQAFRDEWSEKDGNSPGYNLEKARTYGRIAYERGLEIKQLRSQLESHRAVVEAAQAIRKLRHSPADDADRRGMTYRVHASEWERLDEALASAGSSPSTEPPAPAKPVCSTCGDTHRMQLGERTVMCTRCPTPCEHCQAKPQGPYCATTPCPCECHREPAPKPETASFPALPLNANDESIVDAMMAKRQGEARPITRRETETAEVGASGWPDGTRRTHLEQAGKLLLEIEENWREIEDCNGPFYDAVTSWCHAERSDTQRAEPVAQGVSRERVERLRGWVRKNMQTSTAIHCQTMLHQLDQLLAASPDGDKGGGR
jgi:hypothetical protein